MLIEAKKGRAIEIRKTILRYGIDEFVNGKYLINARELHSSLGVGRDFLTWMKDRIDRYGFIEARTFRQIG
jgi:phage anti-repressor protein